MVKIQINLTDKEDKNVEVYKIMNGFKSKEEAIKSMIQHFNVEIKPKNLKDKEYFK